MSLYPDMSDNVDDCLFIAINLVSSFLRCLLFRPFRYVILWVWEGRRVCKNSEQVKSTEIKLHSLSETFVAPYSVGTYHQLRQSSVLAYETWPWIWSLGFSSVVASACSSGCTAFGPIFRFCLYVLPLVWHFALWAWLQKIFFRSLIENSASVDFVLSVSRHKR